MRHAGDPVSDRAVAEAFAYSDVTRITELMRNLITNEYPEPGTLRAEIETYLAPLLC